MTDVTAQINTTTVDATVIDSGVSATVTTNTTQANIVGGISQAQLDAKLDIADFNLSTFDTDDLSEGSTNLYDKAVVLNEGSNVTITGTYPEFTIAATGGVPPVTSVNGETGDVVLTTSDIGVDADFNYVTDAELTVLQNTSGTNTGDQDLSGYALTSSISAVGLSNDYADLDNLPTLGTMAAEDAADYTPTSGLGSAAFTDSTDYATAAQGGLADSALQSGDNVSELVNDAGYITETDGDVVFARLDAANQPFTGTITAPKIIASPTGNNDGIIANGSGSGSGINITHSGSGTKLEIQTTGAGDLIDAGGFNVDNDSKLTVKGTTGNETDNIIEGQNNAGTTTFAVTGAGTAVFSSTINVGSPAQSGILINTPAIAALGSPWAQVGGDNINDNTRKFTRWGAAHYSNEQRPLTIFIGDVVADTRADIHYGGSTGLGNAATHHRWWGASTATTGAGSEIMQLRNIGLKVMPAGLSGGISAALHVSATAEQLRLEYDSSNYFSATVGATGAVEFKSVGTGAQYTFTGGVNYIMGDAADIMAIGKGNAFEDLFGGTLVQGTDEVILGVANTIITTSSSDDNIVAVGISNTAQGTNAVAMGYANIAGQLFESGGVAMGVSNIARQDTDVAIGYSNYTAGTAGSSAIGFDNTASNTSSAIGSTNTSSAVFASALGSSNTASGGGSSAIGRINTASGSLCVAVGASNNSSGVNTVAMGYNNVMTAGLGIGNGNTGGGKAAIGVTNNSGASDGVAMGFNNTALGFAGCAIGLTNQAGGLFGVAIGSACQANGFVSGAFGLGCQANANFSTAIGNIAYAQGDNSLALGKHITTTGASSGIMGWGTSTDSPAVNSTASSLMIAYTQANTILMTATNTALSVPITLKAYTVATLPAGVEGMRAYVTDATAPTYLGVLTGGGAVKCPVFYNGSAWVSA